MDIPQPSAIDTLPTTGSHPHQVNQNEQVVLTFTTLLDTIEISFDMSLLLQLNTIRIKEKINSVYKTIVPAVYPTDYSTGTEAASFTLIGKGRDVQITMQSGADEAGVIAVDFAYVRIQKVDNS